MKSLDDILKEVISERVEYFKGNVVQAAKSLNINRNTVYKYSNIKNTRQGKKEQEKQQLIQLVTTQNIRSIRKLAKLLGRHDVTVRRMLKRYNLELKR